jgi:hypothetical protein
MFIFTVQMESASDVNYTIPLLMGRIIMFIITDISPYILDHNGPCSIVK